MSEQKFLRSLLDVCEEKGYELVSVAVVHGGLTRVEFVVADRHSEGPRLVVIEDVSPVHWMRRLSFEEPK